MIDEHMASVVTNINTPKQSLQTVWTVQNHVQICAFHCASYSNVWITFSLLTCDTYSFITPQKKDLKVKPIIKWHDMQKIIHGADDIITSSPKERPPVLVEGEDLLGVDDNSESKSEVAGVGSKESDDGLSWLNGPPPKLHNVEQWAFSIR